MGKMQVGFWGFRIVRVVRMLVADMLMGHVVVDSVKGSMVGMQLDHLLLVGRLVDLLGLVSVRPVIVGPALKLTRLTDIVVLLAFYRGRDR